VATSIVLLATRAQTVGMLLFGLRFVTPDGGPVGTLRLLVTRFVLPMAALLVASRFPVGVGLARAVNFGCMRPNEGLTLIDTLTESVVTARGWKRGENSASDDATAPREAR
jgi:uncharacterized RDD family membrane protein YckC